MNKIKHSHQTNQKKHKSNRESHFGTYGLRQPVSGSDHKKNLHDKVDNFNRQDGFRRRTVQGINSQLHKYPVISPNLGNKPSKKKNKTKKFFLFLIVVIIFGFIAVAMA
jgi:hypothetical protein